MILSARLHVKGFETEQEGIPVNFCELHFSQEVDRNGRPVSMVRGGIIKLSYASFDESDILLWMVTNSAKNGKIEFLGVESSRSYRYIEFVDGMCVDYLETFVKDQEMKVELSISAREVAVAGVSHLNVWPGYEE
jgi:hypothetical protein